MVCFDLVYLLFIGLTKSHMSDVETPCTQQASFCMFRLSFLCLVINLPQCRLIALFQRSGWSSIELQVSSPIRLFLSWPLYTSAVYLQPRIFFRVCQCYVTLRFGDSYANVCVTGAFSAQLNHVYVLNFIIGNLSLFPTFPFWSCLCESDFVLIFFKVSLIQLYFFLIGRFFIL